jgi:CRP/FNR family cyclic AMP-dependent transcriptional regulator
MSDDPTSVLAGVDLLASLSQAEVARIAEVGRVEYWKEGALVLEEGAFGPRMMIVLEGRVEILRRDGAGVQRPLATLGPGEVLGGMSLLLELPRTATVQALEPLKVFAMDRLAFLELVEASDLAILKLGLQLSRVLARRLMALNDRVIGLVAENDGLRTRFGEARQEVFRLWEYE